MRKILILLVLSTFFLNASIGCADTQIKAKDVKFDATSFADPSKTTVQTAVQYLSDHGSGTGAVWGNITGTLANQTDLNTKFNTKQDTITVTAPITKTGVSVGIVNQGTTAQVLHGNGFGNAAFSAVNLATDTSGVLARTGINWSSLNKDIQTYAVNWASLNGDINGTGINWTNFPYSGLMKFNGSSAPIAAVAGTDYFQPGSPITAATKTKITYDTKGLVTAGADATTADIADSTDKRYVTDVQRTAAGNTSGVNTGDVTLTGQAYITKVGQALTLLKMQTADINWSSLSTPVINSTGINWAHINAIHPINGGGINWTNFPASGFAKFNGSSAPTADANTYITGNQAITLSGPVTGSGTTAITTSLAALGIQSAAINWANVNGIGPINSAGINWANVNGLGRINAGGVNWADVKALQIQRAGINWISLAGDVQATGVNWNSLGGTNIGATDGQVWIGDSSTGGMKLNGLTSGTGISISSGNGSITIAATGGGGGSGTPGGSSPQLQYNNAGSFNGVVGSSADGNGNIGIGTNSTNNKLAVGGRASIGAGYTLTAAPANGLIVQGNVGVGSTAPGKALDVQGTVRASFFAGDGSALTGLTKSQVGLSNVENMALSTWTGTPTIATVGTISSGIWQGSTVNVPYGGTGGTSFTGIIKGNGSSPFTAVTAPTGAIVGDTDTQVLTNKTLTNPVIGAIYGGNNNNSSLSLNATTGIGMIDYIRFGVGNAGATEAMRISHVGNVGIGSTVPGQALDVQGTIRVNGFIMSTGAANTYIMTSDANGRATWTSPPSGTISGLTTNFLSKATGSSNIGDSAVFETGGNVGIGTSTALNGKLLVFGGNVGIGTNTPQSALDTGTGTASVRQLNITGTGPLNTASNQGIGFDGGHASFTTSDLVVSSADNVGIGSAAPGAKLDVQGTIRTTAFRLNAGSSLNGKILTSDASGNGTWQTGTGGSGTPGGSDTQVQYNSSGSFAGDSKFSWDSPNGTLALTGATNSSTFTVTNTNQTDASLFGLNGNASTDVSSGKAFVVSVSGDDFGRGMFYTDGKYGIGSGSATRDTYIDRMGVSKLRISSDASTGAATLIVNGNIGLGTTVPTGLAGGKELEVVDDTTTAFTGAYLHSKTGTEIFKTGANTSAKNNAWIMCDNNGTDTCTDKFGISLGRPTSNTVTGQVRNDAAISTASGSGAKLFLVTEYTGTSGIVITSSGNVGLGTFNPTSLLTIPGLKSTTGSRTLCIDSSGNVTSVAGTCPAGS